MAIKHRVLAMDLRGVDELEFLFGKLGLPSSDALDYYMWIVRGVAYLKPESLPGQLKMFERVAAALPVKDAPPRKMYRGFKISNFTAMDEWEKSGKIKLRPRALSSWTSSLAVAKHYLIGYPNSVVLQTAPSSDVVIVLGPKVQEYILKNTQNMVRHFNKNEIIVRGTGFVNDTMTKDHVIYTEGQ